MSRRLLITGWILVGMWGHAAEPLSDASRYRPLVSCTATQDTETIIATLTPPVTDRDAIELQILATALTEKVQAQPTTHTAALATIGQALGQHDDWRVRLAGAELLACATNRSAATALTTLAQDPVTPVRTRAIKSLTRLTSPDALAGLTSVLTNRVPDRAFDRQVAVHALAKLGHIPGLTAALSDPSEPVQCYAIRALGAITPLPPTTRRALETLYEQTKSSTIREEVGIVLGELKTP